MDRRSAVAVLAARLRAVPPSCGPVRLIAVDGHAGSGKSGFAHRLAAELEDAPIVHLDDLATHDAYFGWFDRLRDQVLVPFGAGRAATLEVYDWVARAFTTRRRIPAAPAVLVEGVGAGGAALRPYLAMSLWMDLDRAQSWRRGRLRDGPEQAAFWERWIRAEQRHFALDPSRPHADLLIRQTGRGAYDIVHTKPPHPPPSLSTGPP